jgi:hypothetical protein
MLELRDISSNGIPQSRSRKLRDQLSLFRMFSFGCKLEIQNPQSLQTTASTMDMLILANCFLKCGQKVLQQLA